MKSGIESSVNLLGQFISGEGYKGYDPYDTLISFINFKIFGKWGPTIAIQLQKRNPINLRPLLGIRKGYNPKGMGLLLKAYSKLYGITKKDDYLENANWIFNWLKNNHSEGFSGMCWGYNFDWANPEGYLPAYTPSVVVTSFVIDGIFEYYNISGNEEAKQAITSSAEYIIHDIPVTKLPEGISYAYTHLSKGCCYNASLLAAEVLAKADFVNKSEKNQKEIDLAINFVLSKQRNEGEWWYSYNPVNKTERKQIDFHQGFVMVSLHNLNELRSKPRNDIQEAIRKGLIYYKENQFYTNGKSLWRIPKKWPVEIHNQSQGIITFSMLSQYDSSYFDFAETIAEWTINNMQSRKGYFYYRRTPAFVNRIPFMRWAQAWMLLAFATMLEVGQIDNRYYDK